MGQSKVKTCRDDAPGSGRFPRHRLILRRRLPAQQVLGEQNPDWVFFHSQHMPASASQQQKLLQGPVSGSESITPSPPVHPAAGTEGAGKQMTRHSTSTGPAKRDAAGLQPTAGLQYPVSDKITRSRLILSVHLNCGKGFHARNPPKVDDRCVSEQGHRDPVPPPGSGGSTRDSILSGARAHTHEKHSLEGACRF